MTLRTFVLAALIAAPTAGTALADEALTLTPPLYREQARTTAATRPTSELATVPRLVPASPTARRVVATAVPAR
ncbi:hypothetical protein SAMN05216360_105245 [Methylobacterium phyllostachyos]|uniref:Uncharacterized protein n=1 Tax=Methylobacterium phyllostachyos TaxID=582672 RepID=A0A1G9YB32_9HYPH|nr:hypothetical protein [Methylobacterium phyllostachyos]SDN06314.1 hypothetical protein SAMN05216360_105245 [Methylobacterium phyllostachyos]